MIFSKAPKIFDFWERGAIAPKMKFAINGKLNKIGHIVTTRGRKGFDGDFEVFGASRSGCCVKNPNF